MTRDKTLRRVAARGAAALIAISCVSISSGNATDKAAHDLAQRFSGGSEESPKQAKPKSAGLTEADRKAQAPIKTKVVHKKVVTPDAAKAEEDEMLRRARLEAEERREAARKAAEQEEAEDRRLAAEQRKEKEAAEQRKTGEERLAAEQRKEKETAEQRKEKEAAEQREAKAAEERKALEATEARIAKDIEEKRLAAEQRKEKEAAEQRKAQETAEQRKAQEAAEQREAKEADERRTAEERRVAEEKRLADEKRAAEEQRIAEEQRKEKEAAEEQRLAEERRVAEEKRLADEKRAAEEQQIAEDKRRAEEQRKIEEAAEQRAAEEKRIAEEKRAAEEARLAAEADAKAMQDAAEKRLAEQRLRVLERDREEEARRLTAKLNRVAEERMKREAAEAAGKPDPATPPAQAPKTYGVASEPKSDAEPKLPPAETVTAPARSLGHVTILLVMDPGTNGIRRFGKKTADPVICAGQSCWAGAGPDHPSTAMPRGKALGPGNTLGKRAGACNQSLTCIFRDVDLGTNPQALQPIDLRVMRHDRREPLTVAASGRCELAGTQLYCADTFKSRTWRAWIVPESVAERAGPAMLEAAIEGGLSSARAADLRATLQQ